MSEETAEPTSVPPMLGFTVAVTAARRAEDLIALLERRGAKVVHAPAIRLIPLPDDAELLVATKTCVETPVDIVVATTAVGFRGWLEAADGWGLGDDLRRRIGGAELIARGPKVRGAIRAAGLAEVWSPQSESMTEVLDHLLARPMQGKRIAVQLHGEPLDDVVGALAAAGADVVTVPVYRWTLPADVAPVERLVNDIVAGAVDAVTFTSAPAVHGLLQCATDAGLLDELLDALRGPVLAACVGPVCSAPLVQHDVPAVTPDRFRLGNLVRSLSDVLATTRVRRFEVGAHAVELRGSVVLVDGEVLNVAPGPLAVLRALAAQPGRVMTREEIGAQMPAGEASGRAVEMAVTRLRQVLGDRQVVQTVVKRGYRLAC